MSHLRFAAAFLALALVLPPAPAAASPAQEGAGAVPGADTGGPAYADMADLVLAAPVIADAVIRSAVRIKGTEAAGVEPGKARFYVEADVGALVRGAGGVPPRIGYVVDVSAEPGGRLPKLRKMRVLVFARPVPAAPDKLQLVAPDAQLAWTPALEARTRAIATAALAADAPPRITGVGNAFHVPGSLPGEGETQVFLTTANNRPVSLSILRRPGERPRWAVALSEIVDESAAPPARDTLLWYRLACGLPARLPQRSTASLEPADAEVAVQDYRFVLDALGPCGRTRTPAGGPIGG